VWEEREGELASENVSKGMHKARLSDHLLSKNAGQRKKEWEINYSSCMLNARQHVNIF